MNGGLISDNVVKIFDIETILSKLSSIYQDYTNFIRI